MEKAFLLPSSLIFEDSCVIDNIRQSYIDLKFKSQDEKKSNIESDIHKFLQESLESLEKDLPVKIFKELFNTITLCFHDYKEQSLPFFDKFYEKSRFNSNFIIIMATIFRSLKNSAVKFKNRQDKFIDDALQEVLKHIQNKSKIWTIFDHQIHPEFQDEFLFDLILSTDFTKELFMNYYGYIFSRNMYSNNQRFLFIAGSLLYSTFIQIPELTETANKEIYEFITTQNFDLISSMSFESLLLVAAAEISILNNGDLEFEGLNKDCILQYMSIFTVIKKNKQGFIRVDNSEIIGLICSKIQSLSSNEHPVIYESLKIIIDNQLNKEKYQVDYHLGKSYLIISCVINKFQNVPHILDEQKNNIFNSIFFLTTLLWDSNVQSFVEKNNIFTFVMSHLSQLSSYNICNYYKFNLYSKNSEIIIDCLSHLQKSDEIVQSISFILNFCICIPYNIQSDTLNQKLISVFNQKVKKNDLKDALLIGRFLLKYCNYEKFDEPLPNYFKFLLFNNFPFDENEMSFDEAINLVQLSNDPEMHNEYFYLLILKMLKDKEIRQSYLSYLVSMNCNIDYKIDELLARTLNQFNLYKSDFMNAIYNNYYYNGSILLRNLNCDLSSLPVSEYGVSIVSKFVASIEEKEDNYQTILILKNIACSFPFLLAQSIDKIFKITIKSFNYISLLYEEKNVDNRVELIKTALSSISLLFSSCQAKFGLDKFMHYVFQNILSFTNEQVACLMIILRSFYNDGIFHCVILAYLNKYNFMKSVGKLLEREIKNESFQNFYLYSIYEFLNVTFNVLSQYGNFEIVQIKEFEKMEYSFDYMYSTIYLTSPCLVHMFEDYKDCFINKFTEFDYFIDFIKKIDHVQSFWIYDNYLENAEYSYSQLNQTDINSFIQELKLKQMQMIDENLVPYDFPKLTIKMVHYLVMNSGFIYCWYLYSIKSSLVQPLLDEIKKTGEKLNELLKEANENPDDKDNQDIQTLDIDEYLMMCYKQDKLYENLAKQLVKPPSFENYMSISKAIQKICLKQYGLSLFLDALSNYISEIYGDESVLKLFEIKNIFDFLITLSKENQFFKDQFLDTKCCDNLIELVLSSQIRENLDTVSIASKFFATFDNNIPNKLTQLIGFIFTSEYTITYFKPILKLCSKFGENQLKYMDKIILKQFNEELNKEKLTDNFFIFLKYYKRVTENCKKQLYGILQRLITLDKHEDLDAVKNFGILFTALAPKRNGKISSDLLVSDQSTIPQYIKETSLEFWNLFESYRDKIMSFIKEDPLLLNDFAFLLDYPELVSFEIRSSLFRKKMNQRINEGYIFNSLINREKILETSYHSFQNASTTDFLNTIQINFINEPVEDQGGGRREWFELLIEELFNPKNCFFECSSKSQSYQPNHLCENHLDYFKFAGKIIARILIEGQCASMHLTQSFYKQILRLDLELTDLKDFDSELFQGLNWMLNNDVDSLEKVFAIDTEKSETIPLKENGENILVNNENKKEYVHLYFNYILNKRIEDKLNAFIEGFYTLIDYDDIKIFNQNELDLLLCGIQKIDVDDFKENTTYYHPYSADCPVIKMFFNVISKWNNDDLGKLLKFMTGSSRLPANGFKGFCENTQNPLIIDSGGDSSKLPQSHTCFNTLHLPQYENEEEMNEKLLQAINYCNTFGLI